MDNVYLIHQDDYIRHIDDKVTLYAMLHQLESAVAKLPDCWETADVRSMMETFASEIQELWDGWNIPARYLVTGDEDDLSELMEDELMEPEDAGYFCEESYDFNEDDYVPDYSDELADIAEHYLTETAKKALRFAEAATGYAHELLSDCEEMNFLFYGDEGEANQ